WANVSRLLGRLSGEDPCRGVTVGLQVLPDLMKKQRSLPRIGKFLNASQAIENDVPPRFWENCDVGMRVEHPREQGGSTATDADNEDRGIRRGQGPVRNWRDSLQFTHQDSLPHPPTSTSPTHIFP